MLPVNPDSNRKAALVTGVRHHIVRQNMNWSVYKWYRPNRMNMVMNWMNKWKTKCTGSADWGCTQPQSLRKSWGNRTGYQVAEFLDAQPPANTTVWTATRDTFHFFFASAQGLQILENAAFFSSLLSEVISEKVKRPPLMLSVLKIARSGKKKGVNGSKYKIKTDCSDKVQITEHSRHK